MKKRIINLIILCLSVLLFIKADSVHKYRWDIKLLIDNGSSQIFNQKAKASTISALELIARPTNEELHSRTEPEKQKVSVIATITKTGHEPDGDYHIVLKSGTKTLISEIPDPTLAKLKGFKWLKKSYSDARDFIDGKIGVPPKSITELSNNKQIKVRVTGIVFFDKKGHGDGHSKNGVEIHPITKIELVK